VTHLHPFAAVAGRRRALNHTGILIDITGGSDSNGMAIWGPHSLFHTTEWGGDFPCNSYTKLPPFHWRLIFILFAAIAGRIQTLNCTGILIDITGELDSNGMAI
jgi:hypothetical protein